MLILMAIPLPFICGLYSYAIARCVGISVRDAVGHAKCVTLMIAALEVFVAILTGVIA